MRSRRTFHNQPRSVKSNLRISVRNYCKAPRENFRTATLIEKRKAEVAAELKLESARRTLKLNNKCINIETKQVIFEENCQLNDCEAERALSYVRAGQPPSLLNDLP